jgi:valyl-tRNA synthetase
LWQTLSQQNDNFLALQSYPTVNQAYIDLSLEQSFTLIFETIRTVRNLRAEADIKPGVKVPVIFQSESETERITLESGQVYLQDLAKIESLTITEELAQESRQCIAGVVGTIQVLIPLSGLVDLANLQAKLAKNLGKIENEAKSLESRLNNPGFVNKAPEAVIEGARAALAESQKQAEILRERLQRLQ